MRQIRIIDSHTEGEPTRVVLDGGPDLGTGNATERLDVLRRHHDDFRTAVVCEPRGNDAVVGALLAPPSDRDAVAQAIFFNNVGYLGMCVHATIGVAATLRQLGRVGDGCHRLETPVGPVEFTVGDSGLVTVDNVRSYRHRHAVVVETESHGEVVGDVAWGGNWFFLVHKHQQVLRLDNVPALTAYAQDVRRALNAAGITGADGAEVDHIELFGPATRPDANAKNFVLCPGGAYDRSPCGTGLSAKMACLAADGLLPEGRVWRQESIVGSLFEGRVKHLRGGRRTGGVLPSVAGRAWITAEANLILDPKDPFVMGLAA